MLARAMEINTFVTNPNVHANKSCSRLECRLLGRRWGKQGERKPEVSAPGCTGVADRHCGWVVSRLLPPSHRALSGGLATALQRHSSFLGALLEDRGVTCGGERLRPLQSPVWSACLEPPGQGRQSAQRAHSNPLSVWSPCSELGETSATRPVPRLCSDPLHSSVPALFFLTLSSRLFRSAHGNT